VKRKDIRTLYNWLKKFPTDAEVTLVGLEREIRIGSLSVACTWQAPARPKKPTRPGLSPGEERVVKEIKELVRGRRFLG
jgi:hypothetical protein